LEDLEYIKKFSKISISKVCEKENVKTSNLYVGKISKEKQHKVRARIESEIAKLYLKED
jgi:hypothetical protein